MPGAELGGGRCQQCGGPIVGKGRRDRKYCSASCRTVAWGKRAGRDTSKASNNSSAAKLDDRLVDRFADALFSRIADASTRAEPGREDALPLLPAPVEHAASETVRQLRTELNQLRGELERSRAAPHGAQSPAGVNATVHPSKAETGGPPPLPAPSASPHSFRLLLGQDESGRAITVISPLERLKAAHREELAAKDADHDQLTREYSALFLAHNKLQNALDAATAERQTLNKRMRDLERQCEAAKKEADNLRKTLEPLRQALSEEDPLLFLMRSKVNLQHRIAVGRESINPSAHGRRLPDDKPETQQSSALYAAQAARREFFALHAQSRQDKATWLVEGRRLDSVSEQKLRKQEEKLLGVLERELSLTVRLREGR